MAKPTLPWWPTGSEAVLLDLRSDLCRMTVWKRGSGGCSTFSEPAYVRRGADGKTTHWGRRASLWRGRSPGRMVERVFPAGWPAEASDARHFLRRFQQVHLSSIKLGKLYLMEPTGTDWVRDLWRETLEDSGFALQGFLSDWQHDALVMRGDPDEASVARYFHFCLGESGCHWSFVEAGRIVACGGDEGLSRTRLIREIRQFARARSSIDVSSCQVHGLLLRSCGLNAGDPSHLELELVGRHLRSGLPTRQPFQWKGFLATKPHLIEAWQTVKRRVFDQARELSGGQLEMAGDRREGFDLPGWWVLTPGPLEGLFVEGPVVRWIDAAL